MKRDAEMGSQQKAPARTPAESARGLRGGAIRRKLRGMTRFPSLLCAAALLAVPLHAEPAAAAPKNVSVAEAEKMIKTEPKLVVLDVRTPEEFKSGHIAGAKNIDFMGDDFAKQVAALDPSKTYLVHCGSGKRSTQAVGLPGMQKLPSVYHLNEGFGAWKNAGKPVEK